MPNLQYVKRLPRWIFYEKYLLKVANSRLKFNIIVYHFIAKLEYFLHRFFFRKQRHKVGPLSD